jgi:1,4-alpha-glucan branching enzyme
MVNFHALTHWPDPRLYIWRSAPEIRKSLFYPEQTPFELEAEGFKVFPIDLDHQIQEPVNFKLNTRENEQDVWEDDSHIRILPRLAEYRFPENIWFVHGTRRVLTANPFSTSQTKVRVHLITQKKYRDGEMYLWTPGSEGRIIDSPKEDADGDSIYFDVDLLGRDRHLFCFKFIDKDGGFEPNYANRLWCALDGREIWVHSLADHVASEKPAKITLTVNLLFPRRPFPLPLMHLWQEQSDYIKDIPGELQEQQGICRFVAREMLFTGRPYGFKFYRPADSPLGITWEHDESNRNISLTRDREIWTLEGDHELFDAPPVADREVVLTIVRPPTSQLSDPLKLDVWVNRSPVMLYEGLEPRADGTFSFKTFPEIVTSMRFRSDSKTETVERHTLKIFQNETATVRRFVVLDRGDLVPQSPIFQDPPFDIEKPGVWERDNHLHFTIHAPEQALVQLIGPWTGWRSSPISLQCTLDGTYWWARMPVADILQGVSSTEYHGAFYKYLLNGVLERQDPAANWVEHSGAEGASRLVNQALYQWQTIHWRTPTWDYLIIYQIHPRRFSQRFARSGLSPLRQVAQEITDNAGYLKQLGVTAIQLLPVNEFAGNISWGYGPAFFYAVESSYGGPDDLKYLVDTCHQKGFAVLLDVVFNHAGTTDNALWSVARKSFFSGNTVWGAMINFIHPQVIQFFEQNLRYLRQEFHVDGFRLDHTHTIVHSHEPGYYVTSPGSGGGWEFLHKLRVALHDIDPDCILIAEHLPNEWPVTNYGGPMDSQWNDDFHDRIVEACKGWQVMGRLADGLKCSHTNCDNWYKVVNYPESHDEVGNVNDRIANVAGFGQGLRRNKVAAAATLLGRGIPMWFMGAESGESAQFSFSGDQALDLEKYLSDKTCSQVRSWWKVLCDLRRGNPLLQGPSPIQVHYADGNVLAFSRGEGREYFAVLNFDWQAQWRSLAVLNLPNGLYRELWNSTWPAFAVEGEDEHGNGGRDAYLGRDHWLQIPDYGVVVLEKR